MTLPDSVAQRAACQIRLEDLKRLAIVGVSRPRRVNMHIAQQSTLLIPPEQSGVAFDKLIDPAFKERFISSCLYIAVAQ